MPKIIINGDIDENKKVKLTTRLVIQVTHFIATLSSIGKLDRNRIIDKKKVFFL